MNRMKLVKFGAVLATVVCIGAARVNAMSVIWSSESHPMLTLADGTTAVAVGNLLQLGNFGATSDATVIGLGANPTAINAAFETWATASMGISGSPGNFSVSSGNAGVGFFGEQAYLVVYNAATVGAATQVGVYKGTAVAGIGDSWIFPASDVAFSKSFKVDDLTIANVLIGGFVASGAYSSWDDSTGSALTLAVPEPSSVMLVGLGLLGMVGLIRRRS